jgi:hypothetical protein
MSTHHVTLLAASSLAHACFLARTALSFSSLRLGSWLLRHRSQSLHTPMHPQPMAAGKVKSFPC